MLLVESIWICKWHHQPAELHSYTAHSLAHSDCTLQNNFLEQQLGCKKFFKRVIYDNSTSQEVCAWELLSNYVATFLSQRKQFAPWKWTKIDNIWITYHLFLSTWSLKTTLYRHAIISLPQACFTTLKANKFPKSHKKNVL